MHYLLLALMMIGQAPKDTVKATRPDTTRRSTSVAPAAKPANPADTGNRASTPSDTEVPVNEDTTGGAVAAPGSNNLGTVSVTGVERLRADDLKPVVNPKIDPYQPITAVLKLENYVYDDQLYKTIDSIAIPSLYLHSSYIRTPVVERLVRGDVLVFLPRFEKNVATWELIVSNSNGETVRRIRQKGNPPNIISWDGRDDNGQVVNVGETYDFTFYAYDAIGNQTRIPGRPQRVFGMLYKDGSEWIVGHRRRRDLRVAGDQGPAHGRSLARRGRQYRQGEVQERGGRLRLHRPRGPLSRALQIMVQELQRRALLPKDAIQSAARFTPGLQPKLLQDRNSHPVVGLGCRQSDSGRTFGSALFFPLFPPLGACPQRPAMSLRSISRVLFPRRRAGPRFGSQEMPTEERPGRVFPRPAMSFPCDSGSLCSTARCAEEPGIQPPLIPHMKTGMHLRICRDYNDLVRRGKHPVEARGDSPGASPSQNGFPLGRTPS